MSCGRHLSSSCVICVSVHHLQLRQCYWLLMGYGCMGPAPAPLPTAEMAQESTFGGGIGGVNGDVKVVCGATQRSGE